MGQGQQEALQMLTKVWLQASLRGRLEGIAHVLLQTSLSECTYQPGVAASLLGIIVS